MKRLVASLLIVLALIPLTGCVSSTAGPPTTQQIEDQLGLRVREAVILNIGLSKDSKARATAIYNGASAVKTAMDAGADVSSLQLVAKRLIIDKLPTEDRVKAQLIIDVVTLELQNDLGIDPSVPIPIDQFATVRRQISTAAQAAMTAAAPYR